MTEQLSLDGIPPARYAYDYAFSRSYVTETLGMVFLEDWVPAADAMFAELELTQHQVDRLMMEYAWRVKFMFTPQSYNFRQRIGLALHFLLGRHVTPRKTTDGR